MTGNAQQMSPGQANIMARNIVTSRALKRTQTIYRKTIDPAVDTTLQIEPRNTGLLLGFYVNVRANVAVAGGGSALTRSPFGAMNLLKNITFFDLNNNTRIQTTGWHMGLLNSARASRPFNGVDTFTGYPAGFGNFETGIVQGAPTIAAGANSDVAFTYYVPIAYSEKDLRGAIYANVVNATMTLQLGLNANAVSARTLAGWSDCVYATADAVTAPAGVTLGNVTVEVVQVYYDQLPAGERGVILPMLDLATIYDLKNTAVAGITPNQDYPIPYSNFRDFLSTIVVYRNRVNADGFSNPGDVSKWSLQSANYTDVFEVRDYFANMWNRNSYGLDAPRSVYTFVTREKPISTLQFGNMELVLDAADAQTGANCLLGYEAFALTNTIGQAAALAGGAG